MGDFVWHARRMIIGAMSSGVQCFSMETVPMMIMSGDCVSSAAEMTARAISMLRAFAAITA